MKFESLAFLILVAILSRLLAVAVFEILEHASYRMVPLKSSGASQLGSLEKSTFENVNEFIAHHVKVSARGVLNSGDDVKQEQRSNNRTTERREMIDVELV